MNSEPKPIKTINDYISHAMDLARQEERQKVVAWLRKPHNLSRGGDLHTPMMADELANAIEVGVHEDVTND